MKIDFFGKTISGQWRIDFDDVCFIANTIEELKEKIEVFYNYKSYL